MPLRMIDWECPKCGYRWEELTTVTASGDAVLPRCKRGCLSICSKILRAPAIRTADNAPRDMRKFTTAGHPVQGAQIHGNRVWDAQLGPESEHMTTREMEKLAASRGLEIVPAHVYAAKHLSYEPPQPKVEDDPKLLRETQEDAADMWDRAAAGKLPAIETPLLDQDEEGRAVVDQMTSSAEIVENTADA